MPATAVIADFRNSTAKTPDVRSLVAYSHYLVMKAQLAGNLCSDGHRATEEENRVAEQCRSTCGKISRSLESCRTNEIPDLLEYYDITYRIGNRSIPDRTFIVRHKHRVLKAWRSGDRSIAESTVFGIVAPEVSYRPERADREYLTTYLYLRERWISTLRMHDRFPEVTTYENYRRLAFMMRENIGKEFGYDAEVAKRRWYEHNRVEDFSTLGTQLLRSYRRFASSLFPGLLDCDELTELDNRIVEELCSRTDLNPYDREAFRLALEFNRQLV